MSVETTCPVDLEDGLARVGDDREFYQELLEIFLEDAPERMSELLSALAASDSEQVARSAHSIKGAAANLSATVVRDEALEIEQIGRSGNLDGLEVKVKQLQGSLDQLAIFARAF